MEGVDKAIEEIIKDELKNMQVNPPKDETVKPLDFVTVSYHITCTNPYIADTCIVSNKNIPDNYWHSYPWDVPQENCILSLSVEPVDGDWLKRGVYRSGKFYYHNGTRLTKKIIENVYAWKIECKPLKK